jgi:hypothetical protein
MAISIASIAKTNMEPMFSTQIPIDELRLQKKNEIFEIQQKKIKFILKREELKKQINDQ